jgi:hypothetical protein
VLKHYWLFILLQFAALIFLPLWLVEALMLAAMTTSVAQGPSVRPPELKEDEKWEDEDPLYLRQMSLAIFSIYLLAQVAPLLSLALAMPVLFVGVGIRSPKRAIF